MWKLSDLIISPQCLFSFKDIEVCFIPHATSKGLPKNQKAGINT